MYKYFVPDEPEEVQAPSVHSRGDIVPLYDEDGEFILYLFLVFCIIYSNAGDVTGYLLKPKKRLPLERSAKQQLLLNGKTLSQPIVNCVA